jgi:hypothetical protein
MLHTREIALLCRIDAGGFSGERVVEVVSSEGKRVKALAPRHYCWTREGRPLQPEEPELGKALDGLVAARRLDNLPGGRVLVSTPDGEELVVSSATVTARPTRSEVAPHVPV